MIPKTSKTGKEGKKGTVGKTGKTGAVGPRWREQDITAMDVKLDKLISAIYEGNGHKPVMERLAIIEEHMVMMVDSSVERDKAISKLSESCGTASTTIKDHVGRIHVHKLFSDFKFWGYLLLVTVLAHEVFEYIHPLINLLIKAWTGVQLPLE